MVLEMNPSISELDGVVVFGVVRRTPLSGGSPVEGLSPFFADVSFNRACKRRISLSFSIISASRKLLRLVLELGFECQLSRLLLSRDVRLVLELFLLLELRDVRLVLELGFECQLLLLLRDVRFLEFCLEPFCKMSRYVRRG